MTIQQLSIFLENKKGTLLNVLEILKESRIQIIASTIADTQEYGIYRVICHDSEKAFAVLKQAGVNVASTEVFAIALDDKPGQAAGMVRLFTESGININYMYSFLLGGKGILVFRTDDTAKTEEVISKNKINSIEL